MNLDALYNILADTTIQLRKGEQVVERDTPGIHVTEIFDMPHESEGRPDLERVDLEFLVIGVDKAKAEQHKAELVALMQDYPNPERLAGGPSYIEVGAEIGDQGAAFQLFALGKVLGLWDIITPKSMGVSGPDATKLAGAGFIMISGFSHGDTPMSDTTNSTDPTLDYLRERRTNLLRQADEINVRINEIDALMNVLEDGRSRVNRQRKARTAGNSTAPPPTQPGGYDDSVSLDEAQGVLAP